jgi:3-phosphoshikimate 1-carboxyvinyltransferase
MSDGCPPLAIKAQGLKGGRTVVRATRRASSSRRSCSRRRARGPVEIEVEGEVASKPYIEITLDVMRDLGVPVEREGYRRFRIPAGRSTSRRSTRSRPTARARTTSSRWRRRRAARRGPRASARARHQGELKFAAILEQMGCTVKMFPEAIEVTGGRLKGVDVDMNDCPDSVQTLACVALFAKGRRACAT